MSREHQAEGRVTDSISIRRRNLSNEQLVAIDGGDVIPNLEVGETVGIRGELDWIVSVWAADREHRSGHRVRGNTVVDDVEIEDAHGRSIRLRSYQGYLGRVSATGLDVR